MTDRALATRVVELVGIAALCSLAGVATMQLIEGWWEPGAAVLAASTAVAITVCVEQFALTRLAPWQARAARIGIVVAGALVSAVIATAAAQRSSAGSGRSGVLSATGDALVQGWSSIATTPAPSSISPRLLVPIVVAVWAAAVVATMVSRRSSTTPSVAPLLPCLALVAAACITAGASQPSGLIVGGSVLLASGLVMVARSVARRPSAAVDGAIAAPWPRLGAAVVGLATAAGIVIGPTVTFGRDVDPFDPRDRLVAPVVDAAATNPLDVVTLSRQQPDAALFTVRSSTSVPIRIASLDRFDGARWSGTGEFERASVTFEQPPSAVPGRTVTAEFWIADLASPWLPSIDSPTALRGAEVLVDPASRSFVSPVDAPAGLNYTVTAQLPQLDVGVLRNGLPVARDAPALDALQLPADLPIELRELAEGITAGAPSAFDEALLINDHLARTLQVDSTRPGGHSFGHLSDVLFETGIANEEQLATTFALLARAVGLPTRVTVGVDPEVVDEAGLHDITGADLRAWPEVRFDDFGWVAFRLDVDRLDTDGATLVGLDEIATVEPAPVFASDEPTEPDPLAATPPSSGQILSEAPNVDATSPTRTPSGPLDRQAALRRVLLAALVGGAIALIGAGFIAASKRRRTSRRRSLTDPRTAVIGAWDDVLERLREVDPEAPANPVLTVEEIIEANRGTGSSIAAMYRPVTRALYDNRPIDRADVDQVWQARDRFVASMNERTSLQCRVRRAVDPRVLRPAGGTSPNSQMAPDSDTGGVL